MFEALLTTRAYWAGQWLDLWSIPHLLFGFMLAVGSTLLGVGMMDAFGATGVAAILWEIFERISGVGASEAPTNSLADILCALAGFALAVLLLRRVKSPDARRLVLALAAVVWGLLNFLGWLAYQHYAGALS